MHCKPDAGFSLIEVLVAVFVLAIGALCAAASQLAALQTRHGTGLMSSGVQLAGALADRMRANAGVMRAADGVNPYAQFDYDALDDGPPAPPGTLCFASADCSSAQMAAFDVYEVAAALHAGFPGGRITVCRDKAVVAANGSALAWSCAGGADAPLVIKLGWRERSADAQQGAQFAPAVAIVARGATP